MKGVRSWAWYPSLKDTVLGVALLFYTPLLQAIALYQLNSSLSRKEFEESMEGWRRTTYGVAAKTEAISVPVSGRVS